jgi:hypothetical protein
MPIPIDSILSPIGIVLLVANVVVWSLHLFLRREINRAVQTPPTSEPLPRNAR